MAETNELKPCPFCGGKGNASERTCDKDSQYNPNDRAYPVVRCSVCFTTVSGKDWSGISTAIEAWNKRATATPPADAALADELDCVASELATYQSDNAATVSRAAAALRARQPAQAVADGFVVIPAAWFDREIPRIDAGGANPITPDEHCCEWVLYQERERIHLALSALLAASKGEKP